MKNQSGFTLIDLVASIALLVLLAATALPRFGELRAEVRRGVLESAAISMQSAAVQVYAKALMQDGLAQADMVTNNGNIIETRFGYPQANAAHSAHDDISDLVDISGDQSLAFQDGGGAMRRLGYDTDGDGRVTDDNCFIIYNDSDGIGELPVIDILDANLADC